MAIERELAGALATFQLELSFLLLYEVKNVMAVCHKTMMLCLMIR